MSNDYLIWENFRVINILPILLIMKRIRRASYIYSLSWNIALLMFYCTNYIQNNSKVWYSKKRHVYIWHPVQHFNVLLLLPIIKKTLKWVIYSNIVCCPNYMNIKTFKHNPMENSYSLLLCIIESTHQNG